eukprot:884274-Pelagomonas_calceolata.AAC.4
MLSNWDGLRVWTDAPPGGECASEEWYSWTEEREEGRSSKVSLAMLLWEPAVQRAPLPRWTTTVGPVILFFHVIPVVQYT